MYSRSKPRRPAPPLNESSLRELALRYVGKYATTRAKLTAYLKRKVRERGWDGPQSDLQALAERMARLGYVDDASYALGQSRSLVARGYGKRRLVEHLRVAGVGDEDGAAAEAHADAEAVESAIRFARRKRIGPFGDGPADQRQREKWIGAMIRAGHSFTLARSIAAMSPGAESELDELRESGSNHNPC